MIWTITKKHFEIWILFEYALLAVQYCGYTQVAVLDRSDL